MNVSFFITHSIFNAKDALSSLDYIFIPIFKIQKAAKLILPHSPTKSTKNRNELDLITLLNV